MKKNPEKIKLGWYVPTECRDKFSQWCADNGLICQDDCAGALVIWTYLPAAIREQAKLQAKGTAAIDEKFWEQFRAGLELALQVRANTPQEKPGRKPRKKKVL